MIPAWHLKLSAIKPLEKTFFLLVILITVAFFATPHYALAVLPGLVIFALYFLGRFPQLGYFLVIFLIPFGSYRAVSEAYPFVRIHWMIAFWLVLLVLFRSVAQRKIPETLHSNLWLWFVVFFLVNLVSATMSDYSVTAFTDLGLLFIAYIFVGLSLIFISRKAFCKTLPAVLILSISLSSFLGLLGYFFGFSAFMHGESFARVIGGSVGANQLCFMIIFTIPLLAHFFFSIDNKLYKFGIVSLFIMNIVVIILTYSRIGGIILSIVVLLILIQHRQYITPRTIGFVLSAATVALLMLGMLVPNDYWERHRNVTNIQERSIGRRISYLIVAWEALKENPVIGAGPGVFRDIFANTSYARKYEAEGKTRRRYAHNTYLEVLVGTGVLGTIAFFMILWRGLRNFQLAKVVFRQHGKEELVSLTVSYQLALVSILIYFLASSNVYHKLLLVSLALSQVALRLSESVEENTADENANFVE